MRFGTTNVLVDVDLDVEQGSHWEVRGDNGTGKTTLLRVLAGTCPPSSGRREGVRPVAFVPAAIDPPPLPVRTWARSVRRRGRSFDDALDALGFRGEPSRSFRRLSYGNLRKVLLADALTSTAALVVLDEAREGLDDAGLAGLADLVRSWCGDGGAVVVADQAAHGVPAGAHHLVVRGGSITTTPPVRPDPAVDGALDDQVRVTLEGPAERSSELTDQAARLGFRPVAGAEMHRVGFTLLLLGPLHALGRPRHRVPGGARAGAGRPGTAPLELGLVLPGGGRGAVLAHHRRSATSTTTATASSARPRPAPPPGSS